MEVYPKPVKGKSDLDYAIAIGEITSYFDPVFRFDGHGMYLSPAECERFQQDIKDIADMRDRQEQAIADMRASYEKDITDMRDRREQAIADMRASYEKDIADMRASMDDMNERKEEVLEILKGIQISDPQSPLVEAIDILDPKD